MTGVFNKVFWQTLWQVLAKGISLVATAVALGLVARNYGPEGTGTYTLATTYLAMFFIVADLGLNAYVLPRLTENPQESNKLFNIRLLWSMLLMLVAILIALVLPNTEKEFKYSVIFGSVTILFNGIFNSMNLVFQKNLKYQESSIASAIGSLVLLPVIFILAFNKVPVEYLVLSSVLAWLANNLIGAILISKYHKFKLTYPDLSYLKKVIKDAWPISLTLIFNVIYFRVDAFILSSTRSINEVGIYNLAYSLFQSALVLPTFVMNSYYPIILKEMSEKMRLFKQLKKGFLLMILVAVVGMIVTLLFSPLVIWLLTGGGFEGSVATLSILSLSFPAFFGSALLMWVLVSFKLYKQLVLIYAFGLIINILLNLIFTPEYSYIATSWITVISEYVILVVQFLVLWSNFKKLND